MGNVLLKNSDFRLCFRLGRFNMHPAVCSTSIRAVRFILRADTSDAPFPGNADAPERTVNVDHLHPETVNFTMLLVQKI